MRLGPALLRLAALAAVLALACGDVAMAKAGVSGRRTVSYAGVTIHVPTSWPVYDLAAAPHTCVRYDRPAVYLGHPGPEQDCPAYAVGRTAALLIEPDASDGARSRWAAASEPAQTVTRHLGGVRLSASFAEDRTQAAAMLESARPYGDEAGVTDVTDTTGTADMTDAADIADTRATVVTTEAPRPRPRSAEPRRGTGPSTGLDAGFTAARRRKLEPVATFTGAGFDTCAAPPITTMQAWAAKSPFKAVGIYVGGSDRACPDGNLTPSWVRQADAQGWNLFPIYVGRQAPCWKDPGGVKAALIQHERRWTQGVEAADDAAGRSAYFGLAKGSTVYFDMEYYPRKNPGCTEDVQAFLSAWTDELHKRGFLSGVYSSASGAIADMAAVYDTGAAYRPDAAWFAHWDWKSAPFGDPTLNDRFWPDHRRIKQFAGGHDETFDGKKVNIDSDWLDAPVAALVP